MPRHRPLLPCARPVGRARLAAGFAVLGLGASLAVPAGAFFDAPAPKVDCTKKENRSKPQCKQSSLSPRPGTGVTASSEEIFFAAYGLARAGQYAAARDILRLGDQADPRVLNYTGFVTRKLGDVDGALPYYRRALAIDPDYVLARAYLGEAYLQKRDLAAARDELSEIERRCGRSCAEYVDLAMQIASSGGADASEMGGG